jgi:hypothetical protein
VKQRKTANRSEEQGRQSSDGILKTNWVFYIVAFVGIVALYAFAGCGVSADAPSKTERHVEQSAPSQGDQYVVRQTNCYLNQSQDQNAATAYVAPGEVKCWNGDFLPGSRGTNKALGPHAAGFHTNFLHLGGSYSMRVHAQYTDTNNQSGGGWFSIIIQPALGTDADVLLLSCLSTKSAWTYDLVDYPYAALPGSFRCSAHPLTTGSIRSSVVPQTETAEHLMMLYPGMRFWAYKFPKQDVQVSVGGVKTGKDNRNTMLTIITRVRAGLSPTENFCNLYSGKHYAHSTAGLYGDDKVVTGAQGKRLLNSPNEC